MEEERLVCYGCAHAVASAPYPGSPSGERPCGICKRNHIAKRANFIISNNDVRITGVHDMYIALDRLKLEIKGLHTQHQWW